MRSISVTMASFLVLVACASPRDSLPDIANIYKDAALDEARNPVVVIHGILGARLEKKKPTRQTVWGAFTSDYADPETPDGSRAMALKLEIPKSSLEYDPEDEEVVATEPLETIKLSLLFNIISVDVYKNILRTLGAGGYRDQLLFDRNNPTYAEDHFTCFTFFYDWRLDNVTNAILLGRFLRSSRVDIKKKAAAKIARLRKEGTLHSLAEADKLQAWLDGGFRFDIVAHSMGGLLARYYLRYGEQDLPADGSEPEVTWAGAEEIDRLVMVGTPNFGSMDSLRQLTQGFQLSFVLPYYDQAVLGSMASIYQLLPRNRHGLVLDAKLQRIELDLFDIDLWERNKWGLLDPAASRSLSWILHDVEDPEARLQKARTYLAWCLTRAKRFHRAMDKKPEKACPAGIYLFAADTQPTLSRTVMKEKDGRVVPTFPSIPETMLYGDISVARYSALGDERQGGSYEFGVQTDIPYRHETFLSDDHIGLTMNPHFSNNLLHLLMEKRPPARK